MTARPSPARFSGLILLAALVMALAGCGGKTPPSKAESEKKGEVSKDAKSPGSSNAGSTNTVAPASDFASILSPNDPSQLAAMKFLTDLGKAVSTSGPFPPELINSVSPGFLKVIGKPTLSETDKSRDYSTDAAEVWLRRVGSQLVGIAPPTGYGSSAGSVFVGSYNNGAGRILIRLSPSSEGNKLEWLQLASAKVAELGKPSSPDEPFQEFAIDAFLDALTVTTAIAPDDRMLLLGGIIAPTLRTSMAEPFSQDKDQGLDFSKSKLQAKLEQLTDPNAPYLRTSLGGGAYNVVLNKKGIPKPLKVKLAKGTGPGQWQVDSISE